MTYSKGQLEMIWRAAGGNSASAPMAAAIALAESGGDSQSTDNDSNGTVDRGLWQINSVHGSLSTYGIAGNARAAINLSKNGTDWTPWVTYNSGAYQKFLSGSTTGGTKDVSFLGELGHLFEGPFGPGTKQEKELNESLPSPGEDLKKLKQPFELAGEIGKLIHEFGETKFWIRVGKVLLGVFLLLSGILGMGNVSTNPVTIVEGGKGVQTALAGLAA